MEIVVNTTVVGREVEAVITGLPRLNAKEQTMTLSDAKIAVAGVNLPDFTAQALLAAVLRPIPSRYATRMRHQIGRLKRATRSVGDQRSV